MKKKLVLNLATHPLRNRRLFLALLILVVILNIVFLGLTVYTTTYYSSKINGLSSSLTRLETRKLSLTREGKQLEKKIETIQLAINPQVEKLNHLIARKSFSWESFFHDLEQLLPENAYVVELNPVLDQETMQLNVRLKLASSTLDNLVDFTRQLAAKGCREIKVISENAGKGNNLVSELSFIYGVSREINH
ncbi:hypothetical protein NLC35_02480 [Candidatus Aminicenantes bacterium AC-334-K16]|jgi:Tfp pilus assembly protein PilN|nr:hypothetical protein [Candidatus Aminicenantes bacterium AC-334-K16]